MIFQVSFKDADLPHECFDDEARRLTESIPGLDDEERDLVQGARRDHLREFANKWIETDEITVEFDTTKGTAVVIPRKSLA